MCIANAASTAWGALRRGGDAVPLRPRKAVFVVIGGQLQDAGLQRHLQDPCRVLRHTQDPYHLLRRAWM
jgi:hypothetical protein